MNKAITVAAATLAGTAAADGAFDAMTVRHTGQLHVEAAPEHAFPLFTAPGERLWAPGWDPVILSGGDGRERGSVWLTSHGDEVTIWYVIECDESALHARYARVTPSSRAGEVEVFVRSDGNGGSDVEVTYELTAVTPAGNEDLAGFDDTAFAQMMRDWEQLIRDAGIEYPIRFEE